MSTFLTRLRLDMLMPSELKDGTQLYELVDDFSYQSALLGEIVVPARFITDFASIPRIAWRYIDPEDPCIAYPSVVHDWLYTCGGRLRDGRTYSKKMADSILREAMEVCGARWDQQVAVYQAVSLFGRSHWKSA